MRTISTEGDINADWIKAANPQATKADRILTKHRGPITEDVLEKISNAAYTEPNPTEAQSKSGSYAKRDIHHAGLHIKVETEKGGERKKVVDGKTLWSVPNFPATYGYIKSVAGDTAPDASDGDKVDVFVNEPLVDDAPVFVLDQVKADTRAWDEPKVFLGFPDEKSVRDVYERAFSDGRASERIGAITAVSMELFKEWLEDRPEEPFALTNARTNVDGSDMNVSFSAWAFGDWPENDDEEEADGPGVMPKIPEGQKIKNAEPSYDGTIACDFDGVLAKEVKPYDGTIGEPIPIGVTRLREWLNIRPAVKVVIFTARAGEPGQVEKIQDWLEQQGLPRLDVTNVKSPEMSAFYDDRAVGVNADGTLNNSGTSAGANKGRLARHAAIVASDHANEMSAYAHDYPSVAHDNEASNAHAVAASAHERAIDAGRPPASHARAIRFHRMMQHWHYHISDPSVALQNSQPCGRSHIAEGESCHVGELVPHIQVKGIGLTRKGANEEATRIASGLFGEKEPILSAAKAAGAQPGDRVRINVGHKGDLEVWVSGKGYADNVEFRAGSKSARLAQMVVSEPGNHTGTRLFARMTDTLRQHGFDAITMEAKRSADGAWNGYNTWARLGGVSVQDDPVLEKMANSAGLQAKRVEDLMGTQAGRDFWAKNGYTTELRFDLKPNTFSQRIFSAYRKTQNI